MKPRRSICKMPYKQRYQGMCALERRENLKLWKIIVNILTLIVGAGLEVAQLVLIIPIVQHLMAGANALRSTVWQHNPIDSTHFNRRINSFFYESEC